ncbi:hypothetical protein CSC02_4499 [Enterobacter hormaechei subsp. hoffmannii]|nr:hypothetical protein CSC02_4499 [Enterobacter hormaechei subsp. hoffmannii]
MSEVLVKEEERGVTELDKLKCKRSRNWHGYQRHMLIRQGEPLPDVANED